MGRDFLTHQQLVVVYPPNDKGNNLQKRRCQNEMNGFQNRRALWLQVVRTGRESELLNFMTENTDPCLLLRFAQYPPPTPAFPLCRASRARPGVCVHQHTGVCVFISTPGQAGRVPPREPTYFVVAMNPSPYFCPFAVRRAQNVSLNSRILILIDVNKS